VEIGGWGRTQLVDGLPAADDRIAWLCGDGEGGGSEEG
jgi:hypothetical protein